MSRFATVYEPIPAWAEDRADERILIREGQYAVVDMDANEYGETIFLDLGDGTIAMADASWFTWDIDEAGQTIAPPATISAPAS